MDELFPPNHKKGRIINNNSAVANVADIASEDKECFSISDKSNHQEKIHEIDIDNVSQN